MSGISTSTSTLSYLLEWVETALSQKLFSGIVEVLKGITEKMDVSGCILWKVIDDTEIISNPAGCYMFVVAEWFKGEKACALHRLPLVASVTGNAVRLGTAQNVSNIWDDSGVFTHDELLHEANIISMCSIPIRFNDGGHGALNLYRDKLKPFELEELATLEQLAPLIPKFYNAIWDKAGVNLIQDVTKILREAELNSPHSFLNKHQMESTVSSICQEVSRTFECLETSVFMEDLEGFPGTYKLLATTWPGEFEKEAYKASNEEGITGWVLVNKKPVHIFDLLTFKDDLNLLYQGYPGITWNDSLGIRTKKAASNYLRKLSGDRLPPLSWMGAPILRGEIVVGMIRCSMAERGPYYFGRHYIDLLQIIANQISQFWSIWLNRRKMHEENQAFRKLVTSISNVNSFVHNQISRDNQAGMSIIKKALQETQSIVSGAEIIDIRMLDPDRKFLFYEEISTSTQSQTKAKDIQARREYHFPLGDNHPVETEVISKGRVCILEHVDENSLYRTLFPGFKHLLMAPIMVEREVKGIIDVGTIIEREIPEYTKVIYELVGKQLGLYRHLSNAVTNLKESLKKLEQVKQEQIQVFQDFEHQLKTPTMQALQRVQRFMQKRLPLIQGVLNNRVMAENIESEMLAIRALCRKAHLVTLNSALFETLARGELIEINEPFRLTYEYLVPMLIGEARHTRLMVKERNINFHVDEASFEIIRNLIVETDRNLFEQAMGNLLDNAGKYSYINTTVQIFGELKKDKFRVSISNKGIPIRSGEDKLFVQRLVRGARAERMTGEGSGIGLWIVDNIMKAHNGHIIIEPTPPSGCTEIKLAFPIGKAR
jgi:signal transduction histidine kinase/putative methionine-R-sulfoxide reductase with GAF domain